MIWLQIILFLAAFAVLMWYMLGVTVRHKGLAQGICGACGYSLVGIENPPCPECGRDRRLDDRQRKIAGTRDTAGMISHIVAVAIVATIVSLYAVKLTPEWSSYQEHGVIGIAHSNEPTILFSRTSEGWQFGEFRYWGEREQIHFEVDRNQIEIVRAQGTSKWMRADTMSPVSVEEVMEALDVDGPQQQINNLLHVGTSGGFYGEGLHASLPAGQPYMEIRQTQPDGAKSILPVSVLQLIIWGLASWRIWSLLR